MKNCQKRVKKRIALRKKDLWNIPRGDARRKERAYEKAKYGE